MTGTTSIDDKSPNHSLMQRNGRITGNTDRTPPRPANVRVGDNSSGIGQWV